MVKKLPSGIVIGTGSTELKRFRTDCYKAALTIDAKVLEVKGSSSHNYSICNVQLSGRYKCNIRDVTILRTGNYEILGFSSTQEAPFIFVDIPHLQAAFEDLDYEMWSKEYLETDLTEEHLADLIPQEIEYYDYVNQKKIGEIVFNETVYID